MNERERLIELMDRVSESLVCRWESNQRNPGADDLKKIAEVTDVNVGWLMLEKGATRQ